MNIFPITDSAGDMRIIIVVKMETSFTTTLLPLVPLLPISISVSLDFVEPQSQFSDSRVKSIAFGRPPLLFPKQLTNIDNSTTKN